MIETQVRIVDTVKFDKAVYYFREDGIVINRIRDNVHLELADVKAEQRMLFKDKSQYLPMRLMVVPGKHASASKEVRDFANSPDNIKMIKAEAIVVESLAHKIMANFMTRFYKTPMPVKIFSDEETALKWLKEQNN